MKAFLKSGFNVLRNISLVIVLLLVAALIYFEFNKEAGNGLVLKLEKQENLEESKDIQTELSPQGLLGSSEGEQLFGMESIEEFNPQTQDETVSKKYEIPLKNGTAYLRPSQILYINTEGDDIILETTGESTLRPRRNLTKLNKLLLNNNNSCFFRIKSAILNCNYVEQLIYENDNYNGKNYKYFAIMADEKRIKIPEGKVNELKQILSNLSY